MAQRAKLVYLLSLIDRITNYPHVHRGTGKSVTWNLLVHRDPESGLKVTTTDTYHTGQFALLSSHPRFSSFTYLEPNKGLRINEKVWNPIPF